MKAISLYVGAVVGIAIGTFVCGVILSATLLVVISSCRYAMYVFPCHAEAQTDYDYTLLMESGLHQQPVIIMF